MIIARKSYLRKVMTGRLPANGHIDLSHITPIKAARVECGNVYRQLARHNLTGYIPFWLRRPRPVKKVIIHWGADEWF